MKRELALLAVSVAVFASGLLLGCGGSSSKPAIEPAMSTVGTLSKESAEEAVVKDTTAVRRAVESGKADEAFTGVYDLINRAVADPDVQHGAALIRRELPRLVAIFEMSYPGVRARVSTLKLKTRSGGRMQAFALYVLDQELPLLRSFRADVARSELTFGAVERWGERNNAFGRRTDARLEGMVKALTPHERVAMEKAVRAVFGSQVH